MLDMPLRNRTVKIQVRVTPEQRERIINIVQAKGYKSIAQFIRCTALEKDLAYERKFNEMYNKIMGINTSSQTIKIKKKRTNSQEEFLI